MNVAELFREGGRQWLARPQASDAEIASLAKIARAELPLEYLALLRFSNGGEGPLALAPMWFQLYSVEDCIELCHLGEVLQAFPDFMFFGSNGGLESICVRLARRVSMANHRNRSGCRRL
jgi:hypothetical protein